MNKVGVIFLLIIALGIALYFYNSGLIGKGLTSLESLAPTSSSTSFSVFGYRPPAAPATSGGTYTPPQGGGTGVTQPNQPPAINPYDIPPGFVASQLSPYFHQVRLSGISAGSAYSYGVI